MDREVHFRLRCKAPGRLAFLAFGLMLSSLALQGCGARNPAVNVVATGPEASRVLPAVKRVGQQIIVVYRYTDHRHLDAHGFDTIVYRFGFMPGGRIGWADVEERRMGGDMKVESWDFPRAGSWIAVSRKGFRRTDRQDGLVAEMESTPSRVSVKEGSLSRFLEFNPDGSLPLPVEGGRGKFTYPSRNEAEYLEKRPEDPEGMYSLECTIRREAEDVFRYRADGYEAICEVYAEGLLTVLGKEAALESVALMEMVMGSDKPTRPLFAYAFGFSSR